jgi:hypothetical protein
MPLLANVWYRAAGPPPLGPPDQVEVQCSLSPISPTEHIWGRINTGLYHPTTYIIRSAVDPNYQDSFLRGDEETMWPVTFFEVPAGSGHVYLAIWCHIVGAGFPNEHARIFACRYNLGDLATLPWFVGWI